MGCSWVTGQVINHGVIVAKYICYVLWVGQELLGGRVTEEHCFSFAALSFKLSSQEGSSFIAQGIVVGFNEFKTILIFV